MTTATRDRPTWAELLARAERLYRAAAGLNADAARPVIDGVRTTRGLAAQARATGRDCYDDALHALTGAEQALNRAGVEMHDDDE